MACGRDGLLLGLLLSLHVILTIVVFKMRRGVCVGVGSVGVCIVIIAVIFVLVMAAIGIQEYTMPIIMVGAEVLAFFLVVIVVIVVG